MSTTFVRGENPLYADKLNTAFSERVSRGGDTMQGFLKLAADPVLPFDAATKQYVDRFTAMGVPTGAYIGASPPGNVLAPLWWDTVSGQLFIQYNDGSSTQWVAANSGTASVADGGNIINVLNHGAKGDGTTDDTAAIQAMLDTYAGKAIIYIPATAATYRCGTLFVRGGTDLILDGTIFALPGLTNALVRIENTQNITIRGNGTLDGNRSAQEALGGNRIANLGIFTCTNIRVSGITLRNSWGWPTNITVSRNVVVHGVSIVGGASASEFAAGSSECWLMNCNIDGTGLGDYPFCFYGGVHDSGAIGNVVKNASAGTANSSPGIGILSDGPQPAPCYNIIVAHNIIHDCAGPALSCFNSVGGVQSGIVFSNNRCYNNSKGPVTSVSFANCYIDNTTDVLITGNQFSANGTSAVASTGIFLGPATSRVNIVGNQIFNVGQGRTDASAIRIFSSAITDVYVSNNYIYDAQTTHTMNFSIIGAVGLRSAFVGNYSNLPINCSFQTDTIVANYSSGAFSLSNGTFFIRTPIRLTNPSGNRRWDVSLDGVTESSGNAGMSYTVVSYDDNNALLDTPLSINRATSRATFSAGATFGLDGAAGDISVVVNAPDGHNRFVAYRSNSSQRWNVGVSSGAETGSNAGSDFAFASYTDAGVLIEFPIAITRATGVITLKRAPTFGVLPTNAANDAAAASAGVPVGGVYRNGSVMMVRTV